MNCETELNTLRLAMQRAGLPAVRRTIDALHLQTMDTDLSMRIWDELLVMAVDYGHPDVATFALEQGKIHSEAYRRASTLAKAAQDEVLQRAIERRGTYRRAQP
ncbi:MAG: hypothetical protein K1X53_12540 [Candidatus Sumerlaeaceae bacterium]|nr:hypothetical protein [Candidatus Sumerlaeaceae bacterium]